MCEYTHSGEAVYGQAHTQMNFCRQYRSKLKSCRLLRHSFVRFWHQIIGVIITDNDYWLEARTMQNTSGQVLLPIFILRYKALGVKNESNPGSNSPYGINAYNFSTLSRCLLPDGAVLITWVKVYGLVHGWSLM